MSVKLGKEKSRYVFALEEAHWYSPEENSVVIPTRTKETAGAYGSTHAVVIVPAGKSCLSVRMPCTDSYCRL